MPKPSHTDSEASHERCPGGERSDLVVLSAALCPDFQRSTGLILSYLLEAVAGAFAVYVRFELKSGCYVVEKADTLPDEFPLTGSLAGRLCYEEFVRSNKPLSVYSDLARTRYAVSDPDVRRFDLRACLAAPVLQEGRVAGALAVYDHQTHDFGEGHQRIMAAVARLLSLIAERQWFECKLTRKRANERMLAAVSAAAIATNDLSFLDDCLRIVGTSFGVDEAFIYWFDGESRTFTPHAFSWQKDDLVPIQVAQYAHLFSMPVVREVIENRKPFLCENVSLIADEATQAAMRRGKVAAFLVLPICNEGHIFGMFTMHTHQGPLRCDDEDLETFMAIAGTMAQWKERRDISRALDESQALIYQLFQLSPTAIYRIDLKNLRLIKVNDEVCRVTGYTEEELLKMKPDEILTPSSLRLMQQRMNDLAAGRTLSDNVEFEIRTKDGRTEWGHFHIRHLRNADGEVWGANVAVHLITENKKNQEELTVYRRRLESLVEERTQELSRANQKLREEIGLRQQTEQELRAKTARLEEMNTAMRVLLDKRNEDRLRSEENIRVNLIQLIEPYLDRLKGSELTALQHQLLDVIRTNLNDLIGSPMPELAAKYYIFSPGELQVANLIRKGKSTKETARMLNISPRTVESFRNSIRKKLGLRNKRVNLKTYLSSKE